MYLWVLTVVLTFWVVTAGKQLIIDVVTLHRYCDFVSETVMNLIALNKGLIAQSKEGISL